MSRGEPLTDADREPWLKLIRKRCAEICDQQWEEYIQQQVRTRTLIQHHRDGTQAIKHEVESNQEVNSNATNSTGKLRGVVVSCSALKQAYRETLRGKNHGEHDSHPSAPLKFTGPPPQALCTTFVFLTGPKDLLEERMSNRKGHFMKRDMLESQLDTLEDPTKTGEEGIIEVNFGMQPEEQVQKAMQELSSIIMKSPANGTN
jgi:gluconokinase